MKRLLLPLVAALALPTAVNANVDLEVHKLCLPAADYLGCVKAMTTKSTEKKINKTTKRNFTRDDGKNVVFDPKTVFAKKIREEYGRYIKFNYRLNFYRGSSYIPETQITPDRVTTNTY